MSEAPRAGWYDLGGGHAAYWDGQRWLEGASARTPRYRQRRNNVVPGLLILAGAAAIISASFLPWIRIGTAGLSLPLGGGLGVAIQPSWSGGSEEANLRPLMASCAGIAAIFATALMFTRARGVGPMWRLLALAALAVPTVLFVVYWRVTHASAADLVDQSSALKGVADAGDELLRNLDIYSVEPSAGLYLWGAGLIVCAIGLIVPAGKSSELLRE